MSASTKQSLTKERHWLIESSPRRDIPPSLAHHAARRTPPTRRPISTIRPTCSHPCTTDSGKCRAPRQYANTEAPRSGPSRKDRRARTVVQGPSRKPIAWTSAPPRSSAPAPAVPRSRFTLRRLSDKDVRAHKKSLTGRPTHDRSGSRSAVENGHHRGVVVTRRVVAHPQEATSC